MACIVALASLLRPVRAVALGSLPARGLLVGLLVLGGAHLLRGDGWARWAVAGMLAWIGTTEGLRQLAVPSPVGVPLAAVALALGAALPLSRSVRSYLEWRRAHRGPDAPWFLAAGWIVLLVAMVVWLWVVVYRMTG